MSRLLHTRDFRRLRETMQREEPDADRWHWMIHPSQIAALFWAVGAAARRTPWRRRIDRRGLARKAWRTLEPRGRNARWSRDYGPVEESGEGVAMLGPHGFLARLKRIYSDKTKALYEQPRPFCQLIERRAKR